MLINTAISLIEKGIMPDSLTRAGIRRLCKQRLDTVLCKDCMKTDDLVKAFAYKMRQGPIAPVPEKANEQHYEIPPAFFDLALGKHRKYSGCYYPEANSSLEEAEAAALAETCAHAQLEDGMDILELGCGWGSLTLWMAEHYPNSSITALSNSAPQREFILGQAKERGLDNITIITNDMNEFEAPSTYDRIVSVEMFEHMRNYDLLLEKVHSWLKPQGKLCVHIFCHVVAAYEFQEEGADNWMGRYFFSGGIMPSFDLFTHFDKHMTVTKNWQWNGTHYERTSNHWLENMDNNKEAIMKIFTETYGQADAKLWFNRWRVFFMACAECFGYENGRQWIVGHYLLEKNEDLQADGKLEAAKAVA